MKPLTLIATTLLTALNIYAQGDVVFDNFEGGTVHNSARNADVSAADGILVQLYASMTQFGTYAAVPGSIVQVGLLADGFFDAGVVRIPASIIGAGAGAFMEVRAWESAYGATYEAAVAAPPMNGRVSLRGQSTRFMVDSTGNPNSSPPGLPVSLSALIPAFSFIPEPSVFALGLIGAGALLLLGGRKKGKTGTN